MSVIDVIPHVLLVHTAAHLSVSHCFDVEHSYSIYATGTGRFLKESKLQTSRLLGVQITAERDLGGLVIKE